MKVKFVPQNIEFEIKPGQSVMHCAQDAGLYVKSVCKGVPSCAECRVRVVDGEHNVLPPGSEELSLIGTGHFIDHRRLSCQLKCFGDITVDMNEQVQKQAGLIGGRKSKQKNIKDDRVEDAPAIRLNDGTRDGPRSGDRPGDRGANRNPQRPRPTRDDRAGEPPAKGTPAEKLAREPQEPRAPRPPRDPQQPRPPARPRVNEGAPDATGAAQAQAGPADPNRPRKKRRRGRGGGGGGGGNAGGGNAGGGSKGPVTKPSTPPTT
jgi:2Fe-2S ferredoxin